MTNKKFFIYERLSQFWNEIDRPTLKSPRFYFHLFGWLITFYFLFISIQADNNWKSLWIIFHAYFWFNLNKDILEKINPPVEMILLSFFTFYGLEYTYLNSRLNSLSLQGLDPISDLLIAILILHLGLLFIINSPANKINILATNLERQKYSQLGLILYVVICFLAHVIVFREDNYYLIIFQIFLFFILLNKTTWLERLTRQELWTYFFIFLAIFIYIKEPSGFETAKMVEARQYITWYSIPLYVHLLFKIYILVLVVKIPATLIYNHAGLERKLKIASLFQSTFPQFIQFFFMILMFFYFISGWQAMNLRKAIYSHLDSISSSPYSGSSTVYKVPLIANNKIIFLQGYEPRQILFNLPEQGVIALNRTAFPGQTSFSNRDYFIFHKSDNYITLSKMDTSFIRAITYDLLVVTGSGILMYPLSPREWQKKIYNSNILQDDPDIRIYPFGFYSQNDSRAVSAQIENTNYDPGSTKIYGFMALFGEKRIVVGRVYLPVVGETTGEYPYFAIDIYQKADIFSFNPVIGNIFIALVVLFLLVEFFVIRRLGKFGSDINNIIVQKFGVLKKGIRQISSGNLDYKLIMGGEDEFVELAGHFNEMGDKLKTTIDQTREKDRLDHELKIARQVQLSLLPEDLPEIEGYRIAASIKTAHEIGGDFYDIFPLDKDTYLFAIGDVSGKGSSAAFYMAQFISLLRFSPQFTTKPAEIAQRLNTYFSREVKDRQIFVTSVIGVLDVKKHTIKFVRTGHTPPVLIPGNPDQEIVEISSDGLGIGLTKTGKTFQNSLKEKTINLKQDDKFVLYTDGLIEAIITDDDAESAEIFGEDKLRDLLIKNRTKDASGIEKEVSRAIDDFYQNQAPVDDYTLLIIQRSEGAK